MALYRRSVSAVSKKRVAYAQEYKCARCKVLLPPTYEVDHIHPLFLGGSNHESNLQAFPQLPLEKSQEEREFSPKLCPVHVHVLLFLPSLFLRLRALLSVVSQMCLVREPRCLNLASHNVRIGPLASVNPHVNLKMILVNKSLVAKKTRKLAPVRIMNR